MKRIFVMLPLLAGCAQYATKAELQQVANIVNAHHKALVANKNLWEKYHPELKPTPTPTPAKK